MRDHGSIGLFREWCFGEKFGFECFGLFLFYFCLVRGEKVSSAQDFGWQSKGKDHFKSWFPLFSIFGYDYFGYLFGLKTLLYNSFIFFWSWSRVFFSRSFFVFFRSLMRICFFVFFRSLIGNFFLFGFLPIFDWELLFCFFCSLPRARTEILIPGQGSWWVGILAQSL